MSEGRPALGGWIIGIALISALSFGAGSVYGKSSGSRAAVPTPTSLASAGNVPIADVVSTTPTFITEEDFQNFWELWMMLKEKFYKQPLDEKKMLYGAMNGLAASMDDPYTVFFEPKTAQEFSEALQGKFEGIGAEIGIKDDQLQIVAPLPETPAERAGLRAGDLILKIDKEETIGMSVERAVSLIRGKRGTPVSLFLGRFTISKDKNGKEVKTPTTTEVTIIRDTIEVKSVRVKYLRDNIALIEVHSFHQDTDTLFKAAVTEVLAKDSKGLVLDLRNDPGGYLDKAISMTSEWVGDLVVVKERRQGKIVEEYRGSPTARLRDMPTIILVNEGSASASEIVAGALQDYKKAKLVGKKTFGKGSVQDYTELPDKSAVKITIAEWVTPSERSINKTGIEPDYTVERTQEDYNAQRDPQLDKALELLTGKSSTTTAPTKIPKTNP